MTSSLTLADVLERVIQDGIEAARRDYDGPDKVDEREGSVAGFEACRGKAPAQLAVLLAEARADADTARRASRGDPGPTRYWYWRCRELEVEWVCNVLSAILLNEGYEPIIHPTVRGALKAAEIVGIADRD